MVEHYNLEAVDSKLPTILTTFQSSCDALGQALTNIKKNAKRETVLAVTADHRMLGMRPIPSEGPFIDKGVPFYLWTSEGVKQNVSFVYEPK